LLARFAAPRVAYRTFHGLAALEDERDVRARTCNRPPTLQSPAHPVNCGRLLLEHGGGGLALRRFGAG
jgi:hypothetical protein